MIATWFFSLLIWIFVNLIQLNHSQAATFSVKSINCTAKENTIIVHWDVKPLTKQFNFSANPPVAKNGKVYPIFGYIVSWFNMRYAVVTDNSAGIFKNILTDSDPMVRGMGVQNVLWKVYENSSNQLEAIRGASEYFSSFEYRAIRPFGNKYRLANLPYGDEYFFEVRGLLSPFAKNVRVLKLNATCSVKTEEGVPDEPGKFQVVPKNKYDIRVSWRKPPKTKGKLTGYIIEYQMLGAKKLEKIEVTERARNVIISGLEPYRMYNFRMAAKNAKNIGEYTAWKKLRLQSREFYVRLRFPPHFHKQNPTAPKFEDEAEFFTFVESSLKRTLSGTSYRFLGFQNTSMEFVTLKSMKREFEVIGTMYFGKNGLAQVNSLKTYLKNSFTSPPLSPTRLNSFRDINFCHPKTRVCHSQASCKSEHGIFTCKCKDNLIDDGVSSNKLPGIDCISNTDAPIDVMAKAMNPSSIYLAWGKPAKAVGEIKHYDIQIHTTIDGKTEENEARANPGGFFTEYEFHNLTPFGLHKIRIRAVTNMAEGDWSKWIELRSETNIFNIVFDFTSTEPVKNYQTMRSTIHEEVTNAVVEAMRYNTAIDFRDYIILNSDVAGQNVVRVTAALFLGKDWQDGSELIETTINEQFKRSVQIPAGAIIKKSIKVSDFAECGTQYQDCDGNICKNTLGSFKCQCPHGHVDVSEDLGRLPGRKCIIFDAPGSFVVSVLDPKSVRVTFTVPHQLRNELYKFWFLVQYKRKGQTKIQESRVELAKGNLTEDAFKVTQEISNLRMNSVFLFRAAAANKVAIGRFSTWVEAKISANIFEGRFNLTQLLYKNAFKFPKSRPYLEAADGVRKFLNRIIAPKMSQYKNSGEIQLVPGIKGRTFAIVQMFFDPSSYIDPKQVSDMFKYNDISDNPYGLDFTSVELRDFDECNSTWSDCSLDGSCSNTVPGYTCLCRDGYIDQGVSIGLLPGRICRSPYATTTRQIRAGNSITPTIPSQPRDYGNTQERYSSATPPTTSVTKTTTTTTTTKAPLPPPGVELKAIAVSKSKVKTTWKRYSRNTPNLNDLTYIIQYTVKGYEMWKEVMVSASYTSLTITDLTPHRIYRIRVAEKWRTSSERHTEFNYPIEIRTETKTYQFRTRLPHVLTDSLSNQRSPRYSEMQDYVTDLVTQVYTSSYMKSHYRQIDFGDAGYVTFHRHSVQGTEAILLVFLTKKSAGGARMLKLAFKDASERIPNPRQMQLMGVTDFNECKSSAFMDCDQNADCHNLDSTFHCNCRAGFTDTSLTDNLLRGRKCEAKDAATTKSTIPTTDDGERGLVISDLGVTNPQPSLPQRTTARTTTQPTTTTYSTTSQAPRFRFPPADATTRFKFRRPTTIPTIFPRFVPSTPGLEIRQFTFPSLGPSFNLPGSNQVNIPAFGVGRPSFGPVEPTLVSESGQRCNRGMTSIDGLCKAVDKYQGEAIVELINGKEISYESTKRNPPKVPVEKALDHIFRSSGMEDYKGVQSLRFERTRPSRETGVKVVFVVNMDKTDQPIQPSTSRRVKRQIFSPKTRQHQPEKRAWDNLKDFFMKSLTTSDEKGFISTAKGKIKFDITKATVKFSDYNECSNVREDTDCQAVRSRCINIPGSYTCRCRANFADMTPSYPGRKCVDQCETEYCANGGRCSRRIGMTPRCNCLEGFTGDKCEIGNTGPNIMLIGVAVGVIGFVALIMAVTCLILKVRQKAATNRRKENENNGRNLNDETTSKKTPRRSYLQGDVLTNTQTTRNGENSRTANVDQPLAETNEETANIAPARPPKPLHYSNRGFKNSVESLPPVPPRRQSLSDDDDDDNADDMPPTPPPKSKIMDNETQMGHADLHSRPPPPPPRGNWTRNSTRSVDSSDSNGSLSDNDLPPRLPPKPANLH